MSADDWKTPSFPAHFKGSYFGMNSVDQLDTKGGERDGDCDWDEEGRGKRCVR